MCEKILESLYCLNNLVYQHHFLDFQTIKSPKLEMKIKTAFKHVSPKTSGSVIAASCLFKLI